MMPTVDWSPRGRRPALTAVWPNSRNLPCALGCRIGEVDRRTLAESRPVGPEPS